MRVVSFNIRTGIAPDLVHCWLRRRSAVAEVLAELDADLIALQEAYRFQLSWLVRTLARYEAVGEGRSGGDKGEHCAVLVKREWASIGEVRTRWFGSRPDVAGSKLPGSSFPRIATTVRIEPTESDSFIIANVHLDHSRAPNRARSSAQIVDWIGDGPRVVLGDLNAEIDEPELAALLDSGLTPALPADVGATAHAYRGGSHGRHIDHILHSSEWSTRAAWIERATPEGRLPSDHWPIVADLTPI